MSNFKVWIIEPSGNTLSSDGFIGSNERIGGFVAKTKISSITMNTILRQNSLFSAAIADMLSISDEFSVNSNYADFLSELTTKFKALYPFMQGEGQYSIIGRRGADQTQNHAYRRSSIAFGGGTQAGPTLEEFNTQWPDGVDDYGRDYESGYGFSFAIGNDTKARARSSFAMGSLSETSILAQYAFAGGYNCKSNAQAAFSYGQSCFANAVNAAAFGMNVVVEGAQSFGSGKNNEILSPNAFVSGQENRVSPVGIASLIAGDQNTIGYSFIVVNNEHTSILSTARDSEYAFALGSSHVIAGTYSGALNYKNSVSGLYSLAINVNNNINGAASFSGGSGNNIYAQSSVLFGMNSRICRTSSDTGNFYTSGISATGDTNFGFGMNVRIHGYKCAAIGWDAYVGYTKAGTSISKSINGAIALNYSRCNADYALSTGYDCETSHNYSSTFGRNTITGTDSQHCCGQYNEGKSDTAFEVGRGSSASSRVNAFEVLKTENAIRIGNTKLTESQLIKLLNLISSSGGSGNYT